MFDFMLAVEALLWLQIWGGTFYLASKVLFLGGEYSRGRRQTWRATSWVVYLLGLPAWVVLLAHEHAWIVAGVELGGAPSMIMGLVIAIRGNDEEPDWLRILAYLGVALGLCFTAYDYFTSGNLMAADRLLEVLVAVGFLFGTFKLADDDSISGYRWFMLMNFSNGVLMYQKGLMWLVLQQALSFVAVVWAYQIQKRRKKYSGTWAEVI